VISHQSAAIAHGLEPLEQTIPTVTVSHRSTHKFPGVIVHQSTDLLEEHLVNINGDALTTVARTLIDLAQVTKPKRLERIVDSALAAGKVNLEELARLHDALGRQGKPGTRTFRRILETRAGAEIPSDSELERVLLNVIREWDLPLPILQFRAPWLRPRRGRIDFGYLDERVVVEGDGRRWHTLFDAFEEDRRRDNAAQLAGWIVLRFTWRMIIDEPEMVATSIREALATRSRES
jgi:very-short-patch-repair endonuclease